MNQYRLQPHTPCRPALVFKSVAATKNATSTAPTYHYLLASLQSCQTRQEHRNLCNKAKANPDLAGEKLKKNNACRDRRAASGSTKAFK